MAINMTKFRDQQNKSKRDEDMFRWTDEIEKGETKKFLIRLLPTTDETNTEPELGMEKRFYHQVGKNSYGYPQSLLCLTQHGNEKCPVCELASKLWESKNPSYQNVAKKLFAKKQYIYNAIIKDEDGEVLYDGQPKKIRFPRTIQNGTKDQKDGFIDAFILETDGMMFDLEKGNDIKIKVFLPGGKKPMEYKDVELQKSSPVFESKKERAEVMNNLCDVRVTESVLSRYDLCSELRTYLSEIEEDDIVELMDKMKFDGKKSDAVDEGVSDKNKEEVVSEDIAKALEVDLEEEEKEVEKVVEKKVKEAKVVEESEDEDTCETNEELEDLLEGL